MVPVQLKYCVLIRYIGVKPVAVIWYNALLPKHYIRRGGVVYAYIIQGFFAYHLIPYSPAIYFTSSIPFLSVPFWTMLSSSLYVQHYRYGFTEWICSLWLESRKWSEIYHVIWLFINCCKLRYFISSVFHR